MEGHCTPRCMGMKILILGIIFILVIGFTNWNIWMVIGVLLVIKGIIMLIMPRCCCQRKSAEKPVKRR